MRSGLLQTLDRRRRSSLHNLNRIVVLASTISATLVALLLQHLLGLGVCKAQQQLHIIVFDGHVVELGQHTFSNLSGFEAASGLSLWVHNRRTTVSPLPCKPHFLAHTRLLIAADLLRDHTVGLKVTA